MRAPVDGHAVERLMRGLGARARGHGRVYYDYRAQALSKIARGHERDLRDVDAMLARGLTSLEALAEAFTAMEPGLVRYPAIDAASLRARVTRFLAERGG